MGTKQRLGNRAKKRASKVRLEAELAKFQETATKDARVTAATSSELFVLDKGMLCSKQPSTHFPHSISALIQLERILHHKADPRESSH